MADLDAVKARAAEAGRCLSLLDEWSTDAHCQWLVERTALAVADVPALVAEVERLRRELDMANRSDGIGTLARIVSGEAYDDHLGNRPAST